MLAIPERDGKMIKKIVQETSSSVKERENGSEDH